MSRLIKLYTSNMCKLLYINYISINLGEGRVFQTNISLKKNVLKRCQISLSLKM